MKFLYLTSFLLFAALACFSQEKPLSYDERGKLIYYEVVSNKTFNADTLYANAKAFLKRKKLSSIKADKEQLVAVGKMVISKTTFKVGHPSGEVSYNFVFEIKGEKYRFWLTDFIFIPYMRDRYANFVPSTSVGTPLEKDAGKLNAAEWGSYKSATAMQALAFANEFKAFLFVPVKGKVKPEVKSTISTKSW
jgi:hypothetical protein